MTPLILIRHGPTEWNADGRIQGHTDVPLSAAGVQTVREWSLPAEIADAADEWDWRVSPLARARQTAEWLVPAAARAALRCEPALIESHWGTWEGKHLADVRQAGGAEVAEAEARGLDFAAPGGESPRQAQARLAPFLASVAARGRPTVAITHKGVIRAIFAWAAAWDMTGRAPVRLHYDCAHGFLLQTGGVPVIDRLNIPLRRPEGAP